MKIGIYGGTFNPPHLSHVQIVNKLLQAHYLDKIIIVPVGNYYNKDNLINFNHRYNMLKLLFDNENIIISAFENQDKPVSTYQTLDYFQSQYPNDELYFISGIDNISKMPTWKKYHYLLNHYKIIVIPRNKLPKPLIHPNLIYTNIKVKPISSTQVRDNLNKKYLNPKVIKYINEHGLYQKS